MLVVGASSGFRVCQQQGRGVRNRPTAFRGTVVKESHGRVGPDELIAHPCLALYFLQHRCWYTRVQKAQANLVGCWCRNISVLVPTYPAQATRCPVRFFVAPVRREAELGLLVHLCRTDL